jgi:spermidine synthase
MTDEDSSQRSVTQLVDASFITLATELVLIRWVPGEVRVIAYFPNLILIAAFLGLGAGSLLRRKLPMWTWPLLLIGLAVAVTAMSRVAFTQQSTTEHLWLLYLDLPRGAPVVNGVRLPILAIFVLTAITFVPLGGFIADRLNAFKIAGKPLTGYAADLSGSLLGVVALSIVLVSGAIPPVWFAVILAAGLILFLRPARVLATYVVASAILIALVMRSDHAQFYSPYYAIAIQQRPGGMFDVLTNGSFHQQAVPLRRTDPMQGSEMALIRSGYHLPYELLMRKPRHVLILGAGTGNDVAVALDNGAERVDAVEIDPQILKLGARHPDMPYSSPRVRAINTDAREFLNYNKDQYDLIVFGTLDSMTRLSALSNVRLDNYVYTVECLEAARRHLTADGGIVMLFMVGTPYIENHISGLLVRALDERPAVIRRYSLLFNRIFLAGPAFRRLTEQGSLDEARETAALQSVPTDDWPYLYLRDRTLSPFYLSIIGAILLIATLTIFGISREMRESIVERRTDIVMFLFGAAFLLTETKLVTEMNLVWGATWLTSSIVFASILLTILIGTLWTSRRAMSRNVASIALLVALLVSWAVPVRLFVGGSMPVRLTASVLFIGVPMLFASILFAIVFRDRQRVDVAFGWNMFGAVAGGLVEFSSMVFGIKAMTLLAIVAYLTAILLMNREAQRA